MIGRVLPWIQAAEPAQEGLDIGGMMLHHLTDSRVLELPFGVEVQLPQWAPLRLGPLTLDLSPTKHVVFMFLAAILVAAILIVAARSAERSRREGAHRGPRGIANVVEAMVLFLRDEVALANIGQGGERYVPFVVTLFFFILFANLLGLVPWGSTATANLSVTAALAVMSLVVTEVAGFLTLGPKGYARTIFYAPPGLGRVGQALMLVIMTPVELLGKLTKPFALAIRLFANMTAGHVLLLAIISLIFLFGSYVIAVGPVLMAVALTFMELFVAFLQAYIFALLSSVFIGLIRHAH